ncbi:calcium-binding protein [Jannaschia aquimarina]|uniref:calcium-binding protein n=1 Tax=Jannaschia aquimarina TaxID=935700 RepID=UPI0006978F2C|nr:cadherin-like domain-containing protein [Jannaschia aquimarina]
MDAVGGAATDGGTLELLIPEGSTVEAAFLYQTTYSATVGGLSVTLEGEEVTGDEFTALGVNNNLQAWRADVTDLIDDLVGDGDDATIEIDVDASTTSLALDGYVLAVAYSNPDEAERSIVFLDGFSNSSGDTATVGFAEAVDTSVDGFEALLSLGIGFGFQGGSQDSEVDIDGRRLTSSAGGQDDGLGTNGGLVTVGGTGDDPANPADPFASANADPRLDDELYDLAQGNDVDGTPFIADGATSLVLNTRNASGDDNIFFVGLNILADARVDTDANDRPDARDDTAMTDEGVAIAAIDVLGNDVDADGDILAIAAFDAISANGSTIAENADGTLSYTPAAGFAGDDTFTYTVTDGELTDTATVTVTVEEDDDDPVVIEGQRLVDRDRDSLEVGADGNDTIYGLFGDDLLVGNGGNDRMFGGDGDDTLEGGDGDDLMNGGDGADELIGGDGNDRMKGGAGEDTVDGGAGNDRIWGGFDSDLLLVGEGDDNLRTGLGVVGDGAADTILVDVLANGDDFVFGFEGGLDRIDLNGFDATVSFENDNTVVALDGGGTITLFGLSEADFTAISGDIFV